MVSYIKGNIAYKGEDFVIIESHGVGYKVFCAQGHLAKLHSSEEAEVFCASRIRKETIELYGLSSPEALELFEALDAISGVGPKAALTLSTFRSMQELKLAIESGKLTGVKGIGTKKLQRIMLELDGKISGVKKPQPEQDEGMKALMSLGFSSAEAKDALSSVPGDIKDEEERVREALRTLGNK